MLLKENFTKVASYFEKLSFPTRKLGVEDVNYELKVSVGGLVIKN